MNDDVEKHLNEIEKHVRAARGDQIDYTPWDFKLPSGADLKHLRKQCDYTRQEVADELDYSYQYICKVESGETPPGRQCIQQLLLFYKKEWPRDE